MLRSLVQFLEARGLDGEAMCARADLNYQALQQSDEFFDAACYPALLQAAVDASRDPLLGLRFGMAAEPDRWGVLGYIMSVCGTLGEAMQCQQRYQSLVGSIGSIAVEPVDTGQPGEFLKLSWQTAKPPLPAMAEEAVAGWVRFGRWITHTDRSPQQVAFKHAPPEDPKLRDEYWHFFRCPVQFNADYNGLVISIDMLSLSLKQPDRKMRDWLQQHVEDRLQQLDQENELIARLRGYIEKQLPKGVPEIGAVADAFNLSTRTLQRRLKEQNETYKSFVEHTRSRLAKRYLDMGRYNLTEITFLLGFSEQSAFSRAFKRWTGVTPRDYQRQRDA